jgi:hypothetical protein
MRKLALSIVLLAACGGDDNNNKPIDASVQVIDAPKLIDAPKPIDAAVVPPDAPPDAPPATPMNIADACAHACTALSACFMEPVEPDCNTGCAEDLADCTAQQVATIDACSTELCGDIKNNMSPLIDCIVAVSCVDMAVAFPRK